MTRPTFTALGVQAFVDLTGPESVRIVADEQSEVQRNTLRLGMYEQHNVTLYLTPGSLAALRDAITNHLGDT